MNRGKGSVLVTGGTGYIGSHTVVELQTQGYDVVIADNFSNSRPAVAVAIGEITGRTPVVVRADITIREEVEDIFARFNDITAVIHFAALKAVGESVREPLLYYRNNVGGLATLLDAMLNHGVYSLVFSSSCTVYGEPQRLPVTEEHKTANPSSPYGNTKKMCEEIIADTVRAEKGKLRSVILRYFNPIGAHPSAIIGEDPVGTPENLVPYITRAASGKTGPLHIFGNDYDTGDGSCIRDYLYVMDLAEAHVAALKRMQQGGMNKGCEYYNLGTGSGVSVFEAVEAFERATGVTVPRVIAGRREGDIEKIWADCSRANRELGWRAGTSLDEAMLTAWRWEERHPPATGNDDC